MKVPALLRGTRPLLVLLATVGAVGLTAGMGFWQIDRAAQKSALQAAIETRGALPELPPAALAKTTQQAQLQHHRRVRIEGRWLAEHTVFLDNRQMNGRPGFFVVTPLQLAPGDALLVQRGWIPRDTLDRAKLPAVPTPAGMVEVVGTIAAPPTRLFDFVDGSETGAIRQNIDLDSHARALGTGLRPFSLVQHAEPGADDGLLRDWPRPARDVHKHYGYAFQWFALAALITGLYVWFRLLGPRLRDPAR